MIRLNVAAGVAALLILVGTLTVVSPRTGEAQIGSTPVRVVNTPLPVTGNVNAAVTGNVNANVAGTVGLTPGATVQVAGVADVLIGNTDSAPVPVVDLNDARDPFQTRVFLSIEAGSTQEQVAFEIPSGKRLVIEHVSSRVQGPAGERYIAGLQTNVFGNNPGGARHWLVFAYQGTFSGIDLLTASHDMRVYAEPTGVSPNFIVTRTGSLGSTFAELNISGYLVNQ